MPAASQHSTRRTQELKPICELKSCECRWPLAEDPDTGHLFCADATSAGDSYCAKHRAEAGGGPVAPKRVAPVKTPDLRLLRGADRTPAQRRRDEEKTGDDRLYHVPDLLELFGVAR